MTKYSKEALDAAEDSVALSHHLTDRRIAAAVFDTLERAPWWEEVEVGYWFMPDEPYRSESSDGIASEHTATHTFTVLPVLRNTYFRDTRWTPPPAPLAIGDVIDTVEDLERLPLKTILIDYYNDVWQKAGLNRFLCITSDGFYTTEATLESAPFTVVHLPKTEATECPRPAIAASPLTVGEQIDTVEDLERLAGGTLLFSTRLHAYWMEKEGHFVAIGSDRWLVADETASYGPFTIRWLPEPEVTE